MRNYVAIDLGATSGRISVGNLTTFEEVHRFTTPSLALRGELFWNIYTLWGEIVYGLKRVFHKYGDSIVSIGVDSWGVDYGLIDKRGTLISTPFHYRNRLSRAAKSGVYAQMSPQQIYETTGIQLIEINTLFQLFQFKQQHPQMWSAAENFLMIPDLINYWLTGNICNESTNATTSQLIDIETGKWSHELLTSLGIDERLFSQPLPPCRCVGTLLKEWEREFKAPAGVKVVSVASHDTASAVAAVPASETESWAFLSSGTWSLLGRERKAPLISAKSFEKNFTNEGGVDNSYCFLKNIMGMWIQQQVIREWQKEGESLSFEQLDREAEEALSSFKSFVNVDDPSFLAPSAPDSRMSDRIIAHCKRASQPVPKRRGEFMALIYNSLADAYSRCLKELEEVTGEAIDLLYIIGGGTKNRALNRLLGETCGKRVVLGPTEATSLGNFMVQMIYSGELLSVAEGRALIRKEYREEYKNGC